MPKFKENTSGFKMKGAPFQDGTKTGAAKEAARKAVMEAAGEKVAKGLHDDNVKKRVAREKAKAAGKTTYVWEGNTYKV